ncbi:hypothetical protein [Nonomuraea roseola]|uniref:Uncharacterized protein n=1 Tax=Nonomuraea roseola TaxID=46179 RepID=A0ABV5Q429_9ACTN
MDTVTVVVAVISIIMAPMCGLLGLWLRWRMRREKVRGQYLTRISERPRRPRSESDEEAEAAFVETCLNHGRGNLSVPADIHDHPAFPIISGAVS